MAIFKTDVEPLSNSNYVLTRSVEVAIDLLDERIREEGRSKFNYLADYIQRKIENLQVLVFVIQ